MTKEAKVVEHLREGHTTIRWALAGRSRHNGFVEVQKDYLVEYDLQRNVSCAEPRPERHTAHVHAPKVSHEVRRDIGTEVNIDSHMHANSGTTETVYFSHDLLQR